MPSAAPFDSGNGGCSVCRFFSSDQYLLRRGFCEPRANWAFAKALVARRRSGQLHLRTRLRFCGACIVGTPMRLGRRTLVLSTLSLMALPTPKDNTTALVTGASSGIGRELARALAR